MKINIREDHVEIEGYVNAIERNSKPLMSRIGKFVEKICKGAFKKALNRNNDVHILLNHDWNRDLGSTKQGNLKLEEDNIGLKARARITDPEVIQKARNGDLVGWSFGFQDRDVANSMVDGLPYRAVKDMDLYEVSILDRRKSPAYDGTLITARSENNEMQFRGEDFIDENVSIEENALKNENIVQNEEVQEEKSPESTKNDVREEQNEAEPKQQEVVEDKGTIDYSKYENIIKEMKEEK